MPDHDQLFKELLHEFFREFIELFFPDWVDRFDFAHVEWLDKELFSDPPAGERLAVDLLARVPTREPVRLNESETADAWVTLIHVEVESADGVGQFRRRFFGYYDPLRRRQRLPVLPIALYLRVGLQGVGWDEYQEVFWGHPILQFRYPYVGLPALDGEAFLHQDNLLGVALSVLMRVPKERRLELAAEAWRRLIQFEQGEYRRYLLCSCVETYIAPTAEQREAFRTFAQENTDPGVKAMIQSSFDDYRLKGIQEGRQEGRQEGLRESLTLQLEARFGVLPPEAQQRIAACSADKLRELLLGLVKAQSLEELGLSDHP